jgi:hypothetical protein
MSSQPLTNLNKKVLFVAPNASVVAGLLVSYGFPIDAGMVQPELMYTVVSTYAQLLTYIDTGPESSTPWVISSYDAMLESERYAMVKRARLHFGPESNLADALKMMNNEYAIKPELLRG